MSAQMQPNVSAMISQMMMPLDSAMQAGVRLQGEAMRWWSKMLNNGNPMQQQLMEMQSKVQHAMTSMMPKTQKNLAQYFSMLGNSYQTSMDLLRQAMEAGQCTSYAEAQQRMCALMEASLGALRSNAHELVQLNTRMMESWAELTQYTNGTSESAEAEMEEEAEEAEAETAKPRRMPMGKAARGKKR